MLIRNRHLKHMSKCERLKRGVGTCSRWPEQVWSVAAALEIGGGVYAPAGSHPPVVFLVHTPHKSLQLLTKSPHSSRFSFMRNTWLMWITLFLIKRVYGTEFKINILCKRYTFMNMRQDSVKMMKFYNVCIKPKLNSNINLLKSLIGFYKSHQNLLSWLNYYKDF